MSEDELRELEKLASKYKLAHYAWQVARAEYGDNDPTTVERLFTALDVEKAYLQAVAPDILTKLLADLRDARAEIAQLEGEREGLRQVVEAAKDYALALALENYWHLEPEMCDEAEENAKEERERLYKLVLEIYKPELDERYKVATQPHPAETTAASAYPGFVDPEVRPDDG